MFKGCQGKVLFIDLSSGEIKKELLQESDYKNYLGGYGLACKIIYERMKANVDPLGPENILAFTTGLLVGTPAISGLRFTVSAKSPLTRTWGDANCGGYFGPALKFSGYDAIFFTGCAQKPKYLFIDNGEVKLCDAKELWGKDTSETEDILKEQLGNEIKVACIGPAGENISLISCIMHDKGRAAGRSGLGAVMGSKKLKAVVVKGNIKIPLYDSEKAKELRKKWRMALMEKPSSQKFLKYGTISHVASSTFINDAPVKNWAGVGVRDFPQADLISDDNILKYEYKKYGCWQCPLACSGYYQVEEGPYIVKEAHKPEYETCGVLGPNLLNDNLESIIKMNDMFNRAGMDTISAGIAIGFAIECFEKGLITEKDTEGLKLTWGNHKEIVELARKICCREGKIGELLADGTKVAAEKIGNVPDEVISHINAQEPPAHDPKYGPGWGTYYLVDATPGRHTQGSLNSYENGKGIEGLDFPLIDKYKYSGKGEMTARLHNIFHAFHSLGLCRQVLFRMNAKAWPEFLEAVTGEEYTLEKLEWLGARIGVLRQVFNIREGIQVTKYKIPGRLYGNPPLDDGPLKGITVDIDTQVREYYEYQGWDPETGKPSRERLRELDLEYLIPDIYS